jgi:hypothetical protein
LGGGCDIVTSMFTHNEDQFIDNGMRLLHNPYTIHTAQPEIVESPAKLIFGSWK